jgi:hypothetical protein
VAERLTQAKDMGWPSTAPSGASGASKRSLSGSGALLLELLPLLPRPTNNEKSMLRAMMMPNTIMIFSDVDLLLLALFFAITSQDS